MRLPLRCPAVPDLRAQPRRALGPAEVQRQPEPPACLGGNGESKAVTVGAVLPGDESRAGATNGAVAYSYSVTAR